MAGTRSGLSGKDGGLMLSRKMRMTLPDSEGNPSEVDIGLVGEVVAINPGVLNALEGANYIPVIAPVGYDHEGNTYNINADLAAGKIAAALKAEKLILMTDVAGIRDKHDKLVSTLDVAHAQQMIEHGTISEGMIPKAECCIDALREGVAKTHIIDGRVLHSLLLETFTRSGIGTEVLRGTRVRKHAGA